MFPPNDLIFKTFTAAYRKERLHQAKIDRSIRQTNASSNSRKRLYRARYAKVAETSNYHPSTQTR